MWGALEKIVGLSALAVVWRQQLGDCHDVFHKAFLMRSTLQARSYPCPRDCGCVHDVVLHSDGTIAGVCTCDPWSCEDICLDNVDLALYALNWSQLGRALCQALGIQSREVELNTANTLQIGAYTDKAIPVILTIQHDREAFLQAIAVISSRRKDRYILLAPTAAFRDAETDAMLDSVNAGFISIQGTFVLMPSGALKTLTPAHEVLSPFAPDNEETPENVVASALLLIDELDTAKVRKKPSHSAFFKMYCVNGWSLNTIMKKTGCSQGTASNRKRDCETMLNASLDSYRKHGSMIEKIAAQYQGTKARKIRGKSVIYDDAAYDE
jgi:hypothetical protein